MTAKQKNVMAPLSVKLLLVLAAVLSLGYSVAAQVADSDNQQTPTTTSVTLLNPFTLAEYTVPVTNITGTGDNFTFEYEHQNHGLEHWHQHRHRVHRSPCTPELYGLAIVI
jgi:hypothetical protein